MKYELNDLLVRAQAHAWSIWQRREGERQVEDVLANRHPIPMPKSLENRIQKVYTGYAIEKKERAKFKLRDPEGPRFTVGRNFNSDRSERDAERVQNWIEAAYRIISHRSDQMLDESIVEDLVVKSRAWVRIMPMPKAWADIDAPSISDEETLEKQKKKVDDQEKFNRQIMRRHLPLKAQSVPAANVIARWDDLGCVEVWEIQYMPVQEVLSTWVDDKGKPLAVKLADDVREMKLSDRDLCTVIIRADRNHVQVCVGAWLSLMGQPDRYDYRLYGSPEIVYEEDHSSLGRVPYAYFQGRLSNTGDPVQKYNGLINPIAGLVEALDLAETQRASSARFSAWPGLYIVKSKETSGGADQGKDIQIDEAGVWEGLGVGEELKAIQWTTMDMQLLSQQIEDYKNLIDRATFGTNSQLDASSGYERAQVTVQLDEPLEPFRMGLQYGYADFADLLLKQARRLMQDLEVNEIPVRFVEGSDLRWISLTKDLADQDWYISATVQPRPPGGEMAAVTIAQTKVAAGFQSRLQAVASLGDRYPQRTLDAVDKDQLKQAPEIKQAMLQAFIQRFMPLMTQAQTPSLPQGSISGALASQIQSPLLRAQIGAGDMSAGGAGMMGQPPGMMPGMNGGTLGLPGATGGNMAPPPPIPKMSTMMGGRAAVDRRGPPSGQAKATPGGIMRQDVGP